MKFSTGETGQTFNPENPMAEDDTINASAERRSEARKETNGMYGAELNMPGVPIYRFKFKDISHNGACVLIKEDSSAMNYLQAGLTIDMMYNSPVLLGTPILKSEIRHITKAEQGRFKGHYLVGFLISEK